MLHTIGQLCIIFLSFTLTAEENEYQKNETIWHYLPSIVQFLKPRKQQYFVCTFPILR